MLFLALGNDIKRS